MTNSQWKVLESLSDQEFSDGSMAAHSLIRSFSRNGVAPSVTVTHCISTCVFLRMPAEVFHSFVELYRQRFESKGVMLHPEFSLIKRTVEEQFDAAAVISKMFAELNDCDTTDMAIISMVVLAYIVSVKCVQLKDGTTVGMKELLDHYGRVQTDLKDLVDKATDLVSVSTTSPPIGGIQ